jgi:hypothetical protein
MGWGSRTGYVLPWPMPSATSFKSLTSLRCSQIYDVVSAADRFPTNIISGGWCRVYPDRTVQLDEGMGRSAYLCPQEPAASGQRKRKIRLGRILKGHGCQSIHLPGSLWQRLNSPTQKFAPKLDSKLFRESHSTVQASRKFVKTFIFSCQSDLGRCH